MRRSFSSLAVLVILLASFGLMGCPKKAPSVEGSAGLSKEKSDSTAPGNQPGGSEAKPLPPHPKEEKLPPMAKEEANSDGTSGQSGGETPSDLQDVFFDFDQWVIRPESRKLLEADAQWLAANPKAKIQIEGHADERGTEEYNLALGERRAKSVMNFLVNLGVNPARLSSISYGEEKPFCNDKSDDCYAKNRRAHFGLAPR